MKSTLDESPLHEISCEVSEKLSDQMRMTSEQVFASGKKVNMLFNWQLGDKVKVINRLMNRIMDALGPSPLCRSSTQKPVEGEEDIRESNAAMSLLSFISVCKGLNGKPRTINQPVTMTQSTVRERLVKIIYEANEYNRAYYLEEKTKQLFGRCLRLFFFYQKKDVYETLMLHDYGFYKFEKFENFIDHNQKEKKEDDQLKDHIKPLFATRD